MSTNIAPITQSNQPHPQHHELDSKEQKAVIMLQSVVRVFLASKKAKVRGMFIWCCVLCVVLYSCLYFVGFFCVVSVYEHVYALICYFVRSCAMRAVLYVWGLVCLSSCMCVHLCMHLYACSCMRALVCVCTPVYVLLHAWSLVRIHVCMSRL